MNNGALYRRFRPDTFQKVIGQDHIVRTLVNQIENGNLSHAYLFTGTRGTGKTSTAKIFARAVNCEHPIGGSACGKCATCLELQNPSNLDILEIDAASNNGVDEIRELKENVRYRPSAGKYKVYIIDEVHMLTASAFNALLKTLEEPPPHVIFILATTEVHKLPQTVLSRCIRFDFRLVSEAILTKHLKYVFDEIGQEYDEEALAMLARHGEGSVRDTLSAADMLQAYANGKITAQIVADALGSTAFDTLYTLAAEILSGDVVALLRDYDKINRDGKNVTTLAKDLGSFFMNILFSESVPAKDLGMSEKEFSKLVKLEESAEHKKMTRAIEILTALEGELRYTTQPKLLVGAALVKAAEMVTDVSGEATLARIRTLEKELQSLKQGGFVAMATNNAQSVAIDTNHEKKKEESAAKLKEFLEGAKEVEVAPLFHSIEDEAAQQKALEEKQRGMQLWQNMRELLKEKKEFTLSAAAGDIAEVCVSDTLFEVITPSKQAFEVMNDADNFKTLNEVTIAVMGENTDFKCSLQGAKTTSSKNKEGEKRTLEDLFGKSLLKK